MPLFDPLVGFGGLLEREFFRDRNDEPRLGRL